MMRKSVDLPDPERPSSATISPVFRLSETSLKTGARVSPDPVWKTWVTLLTLKSVAIAGSNMAKLLDGRWASEAQPPLRVGVEPAPEQAIENRDEDGHHGDAEHDFRE